MRFRDMEEYEYVSREGVLTDPVGSVVGVRWFDHHTGACAKSTRRIRICFRCMTRRLFGSHRTTDCCSSSGCLGVLLQRRGENLVL